jgi:Fe2+ or Zn2+ uptake regulation protein
MRRGIVEPENIKESAQLGQRQTRQRDAVLRVIIEANGPLSVPEIHQRAIKAHAGIGIATIIAPSNFCRRTPRFKR